MYRYSFPSLIVFILIYFCNGNCLSLAIVEADRICQTFVKFEHTIQTRRTKRRSKREVGWGWGWRDSCQLGMRLCLCFDLQAKKRKSYKIHDKSKRQQPKISDHTQGEVRQVPFHLYPSTGGAHMSAGLKWTPGLDSICLLNFGFGCRDTNNFITQCCCCWCCWWCWYYCCCCCFPHSVATVTNYDWLTHKLPSLSLSLAFSSSSFSLSLCTEQSLNLSCMNHKFALDTLKTTDKTSA